VSRWSAVRVRPRRQFLLVLARGAAAPHADLLRVSVSVVSFPPCAPALIGPGPTPTTFLPRHVSPFTGGVTLLRESITNVTIPLSLRRLVLSVVRSPSCDEGRARCRYRGVYG